MKLRPWACVECPWPERGGGGPALSGPACRFSLAAGQLEHHCSCCRELRASPRTVTLRCADGSSRAFSYTQVEECGCAGLRCDTLGGDLLGQRQRWSRGARALPAA